MQKFIPFVIFLISIRYGQFQREDVNDDEFLQSSDPLLRKFWGIQDVTTSVGKLFHYKIPNDAFKGTILYYDVISEENAALPDWMIYDKNRAVIEGVPSTNDIGDTRINVKAYDNKGQYVSDIFVVEVYPLWEKNTNNKRKCKKGEGVMMISLVIDKELADITPKQKITALKNLAHHLHFPVNTLLFLSSKENLEISSDSLAFENNGIPKDADLNSSIITWQIGCREKIWAEKLQVVELVEKYVSDGTFSTILQLPVIRWHIASSFSPFRTRRHSPQNNGLSNLDSEQTMDDDDDDVEEEDDPLDNNEDLDDAVSSGVPSDTASPVLPDTLATRLYKTGPGATNPTHSNKRPIIDSVISNQTFERLNINPNSTTSLLSSDLGDEDTTESFNEDDDLINFNATFGRDFSPNAESPTTQTNLTSTFTDVSGGSTSTEKATTFVPKRYPPRVERNLDQMRIEAGKPYKIKIPEDIFIDAEDGNTRNLTLRLIKTDNCSLYTPWIELNSETQELYILASLDTISKHEFAIEATNSGNLSSTNSLIVNVQYPPNARTINFEISLHMKLHENQKLSVYLQFNLLSEIARLFNDQNTNKITVRNVTCDPFVFTWANNTLPSQSCDNTTIFGLLDVLTKSPGSMDIKKDVYRDFDSNVSVIVEKVTWRGSGLCSDIPLPRLPQPEKQNFKPMVRNRIDNITATVGELKVFRIPEDTFFDPDEPNARNLKLSWLTMDHLPISSDNWLQFDPTNQEFYGLPMANDVGSFKYQLVCNDNQDDSESMKARLIIEVIVEPATKVYYNVEFRMKLSASYEEFVRSPLTRRTFVEKLAKLFGDKTTSSIVVSGYSPGSLIVTWHNKSLPVNECIESEIVQLRKVLITEEQKLEDNVNKVLKPEFEALSADITPIGICEGGLTEVHPLPPEVNTGSQEIHAIIFNNVYFMNSILPIAIIVIMILVAGLIACILYRRQRRAKWTLGDEDERRSFRNKGIPVIFQDELEERLEPTNKSPIIMKEEKPPLPPPEYQKVAPVATTALLSDFDDPSYQQGSGTYTSRSTERNGRSKPTPIYRKPPPYVSQ